jgi:hypothetical protein
MHSVLYNPMIASTRAKQLGSGQFGDGALPIWNPGCGDRIGFGALAVVEGVEVLGGVDAEDRYVGFE